MNKEKLSKIIDTVKEKVAESDIVKHKQKFKYFSDGEKEMLKGMIEDAWSKGKIKDKAMARYMLKALDSDLVKNEE